LKEIKTHFLIFVTSIAILFFLILNIYSLYAACIFLICTFTLVILYHTFWIYRLSKWLDNRAIKNLPNGYGVWEKLFTQIYRTETKQKKSKQELFELLEQFKSAAGVMLDGVIAIDENDEILWSNKTAQKMLNIIPKNDYHRPITYIFRKQYF
jgi:two-component system phosphate regulon sensor histidine kinase PhoR